MLREAGIVCTGVLTRVAAHFSRDHQLYRYSKSPKYFMEPGGSLLCTDPRLEPEQSD
jgi:hypothetical protein